MKHRIVEQLAEIGTDLSEGVMPSTADNNPATRLVGVGGLDVNVGTGALELAAMTSKSIVAHHKIHESRSAVGQWTVNLAWPRGVGGKSLEILAPIGPYRSSVAFYAAKLSTSLEAIGADPQLSSSRLGELRGPLDQFCQLLHGVTRDTDEYKLMDDDYVLSHGDLHSRHIMIDEEAGRITAILNWSQAGLVAASRRPWDVCELNAPRPGLALKERTNRTLQSLTSNALQRYKSQADIFKTEYVSTWLGLNQLAAGVEEAVQAWMQTTHEKIQNISSLCRSERVNYQAAASRLCELGSDEERQARVRRVELQSIRETLFQRTGMEVLGSAKENKYQRAMRSIVDTVYRHWQEILLGEKKTMPESMRVSLVVDLQMFDLLKEEACSFNPDNDNFGTRSLEFRPLRAVVEEHLIHAGVPQDEMGAGNMTLKEHMDRDFEDEDGSRFFSPVQLQDLSLG